MEIVDKVVLLLLAVLYVAAIGWGGFKVVSKAVNK